MSSPCGAPMMTSHRCAASVLRTKPVACGYQAYAIPLPSLLANSSASLFSNPSPLSVENGMLCGSAQTLNTFGSINSSDDCGRSSPYPNDFTEPGTVTAIRQNAARANRFDRAPTANVAMAVDLISSRALSFAVPGNCFPISRLTRVCPHAFAAFRGPLRHWHGRAGRQKYRRDNT